MERMEWIERYINGSLSEGEIQKFSEMLSKDPELSELVKLYTDLNESISDHELHAMHTKIRKASDRYFMSEGKHAEDSGNRNAMVIRKLTASPYFRSVAGFLLMVSLLLLIKLLFFNKMDPGQLFEKYYRPYAADAIVRSQGAEEGTFTAAISDYQLGNYEKAYKEFSDLNGNVKDMNLLSFYEGLTLMALNRFDEAVVQFTSIPLDWDDPYSIHRNWYLGLASLKTGNTVKAAEIFTDLASNHHYYSRKASILLRKIRS